MGRISGEGGLDGGTPRALRQLRPRGPTKVPPQESDSDKGSSVVFETKAGNELRLYLFPGEILLYSGFLMVGKTLGVMCFSFCLTFSWRQVFCVLFCFLNFGFTYDDWTSMTKTLEEGVVLHP